MHTMKRLARDRFLRFAALTLSNHEEGAISLSDAVRLIESHGGGMAEAFGAVEQFELVKVVEETRADVKLFLETQHGFFDYQWLIMSERTVGRFQQLVNELQSLDACGIEGSRSALEDPWSDLRASSLEHLPSPLPCCYWAKLFAIFVDKSVEMGPKKLFLLLIKRQSNIDQV